MSISNIDIAKMACMSEATPELQNYWQKRYQDLLQQELFFLSSKSQELLLEELVDKPATPFGDVVLLKHLTKNGELDELLLQNTVETSTRFLDALLEQFKFTPEAASIVSQYRKIGLGVSDFKEYLNTKKTSSELDEIDYLGNFIATTGYRASESLAEEKGVCTNWPKINKHLRPKAFEYWYNPETGDIKSGLEMSELFDENTVKNSQYEIVPRRNSHILLFPLDLEWQIWSDRDNTSPITEITPILSTLTSPIEKINPNTKYFAQPVYQKAELSDNLQQTDLITDQLAVNSASKIEEEDENNQENNDNLYQSQNTTTLSPIPTEDKEATAATEFQIGELVKVIKTEQPETNKVFQIVDMEEGETASYTLFGEDNNLADKKWLASELEPVDLAEILEKVNKKEEILESKNTENENLFDQEELDRQLEEALNRQKIDFEEAKTREIEELQEKINNLEESKARELEEKINSLEELKNKELEEKINSLEETKNKEIETLLAEHKDNHSKELEEKMSLLEQSKAEEMEKLVQQKISSEKIKWSSELNSQPTPEELQQEVDSKVAEILEKEKIELNTQHQSVLDKNLQDWQEKESQLQNQIQELTQKIQEELEQKTQSTEELNNSKTELQNKVSEQETKITQLEEKIKNLRDELKDMSLNGSDKIYSQEDFDTEVQEEVQKILRERINKEIHKLESQNKLLIRQKVNQEVRERLQIELDKIHNSSPNLVVDKQVSSKQISILKTMSKYQTT